MEGRPIINGDLSWKLQARVCAVDSYIEALIQGGDMGDAIKIFDVRWNTPEHNKANQLVKAPEHYVQNQVNKLYASATLRNLCDHPRPPKIPNEEVKKAADILAAGYSLPCYSYNWPFIYSWWEHRHFTSINEACKLSPELHTLLVQHDVTPRHLLTRIHEVCPHLAYSALPLKMELTAAQKLARQQHAEWMLQQLQADPLFLHKILWGDETRIYIGKELDGKLKVYHYTGQPDSAAPEECRLMNKENMLRIDLLLFVSAVWGVCHVEFLTGTTNIENDGRFTPGMKAKWEERMRSGAGPYKVSQ